LARFSEGYRGIRDNRLVIRLITDKSLVLATRFGSQGVRILATMVLARFVSKEDYGHYELILTIPSLLAAVGDLGVTRSVTGNHDLPDDEVRDTALIFLFLLSLVFAALAVAGGWYYARNNNDARLLSVGVIVAATFVVQNVQASQMAMLARELRFARWAGVEALMMLATVLTGIVVAVAGGGIFALALQQLMAQICGLIVTVHAKPLRWPRAASRTVTSRLLSQGWKISIYQWTNNVQGSLSRMAIGQVAGVTAVGVFGRASGIRDLIGFNLVNSFDLVLMPLFARAKDDPARLRDLLVRGSVGVTSLCGFGVAWLFAVAPDLIRVVLGRNWSEVPDLLRALSPALAIQALAYPCVVLSLAINRPMVAFRYALINLIGLLCSVIVLWKWGLWHFAVCQSLVVVVPTLYAAYWGTHMVGYSARSLFWRLAPILVESFIACLAMLLVDTGIRAAIEQWWPAILTAPPGRRLFSPEQIAAVFRLTFVSLFGGFVIWLLLVRFDRRNYLDLVSLLIRRRHTSEKASLGD
jgi:PST family polysaccharide transporter